MKWRVIIRERAEGDLREARDWYERQKTGLGQEFLTEIRITFQLLLDDPKRYPDYYRGFRRVLMRRFPYKLFYRLEEDQIMVFRILHSHRDHARLLPPQR